MLLPESFSFTKRHVPLREHRIHRSSHRNHEISQKEKVEPGNRKIRLKLRCSCQHFERVVGVLCNKAGLSNALRNRRDCGPIDWNQRGRKCPLLREIAPVWVRIRKRVVLAWEKLVMSVLFHRLGNEAYACLRLQLVSWV